jgi:GNAT superfamily N-acetyltransferase
MPLLFASQTVTDCTTQYPYGSFVELFESSSKDINDMALLYQQAQAYRDKRPWPAEPDERHLYKVHYFLNEPDAWSQLSRQGKKMTGFIIGCSCIREDGSAYERLNLLMVHPDYWGKGIAGSLIEWALFKYPGEMRLWTLENNKRARSLYERYGFAQLGKAVMRHPEIGVPSVEYVHKSSH